MCVYLHVCVVVCVVVCVFVCVYMRVCVVVCVRMCMHMWLYVPHESCCNAALTISFDIPVHVLFRKPGAMQPARRMTMAIYSMKIELLFRGNKTVIQI